MSDELDLANRPATEFELFHKPTVSRMCEELTGLRIQVKEPLTEEGWMYACIEAREERDRLRASIALKDKALRDAKRFVLANHWNVGRDGSEAHVGTICQLCDGALAK